MIFLSSTRHDARAMVATVYRRFSTRIFFGLKQTPMASLKWFYLKPVCLP